MAPIDDPVNLVGNTLSVVSAHFNRIRGDYGMLFLFPVVYQCIQCRNLHKAKEHLARLHQA